MSVITDAQLNAWLDDIKDTARVAGTILMGFYDQNVAVHIKQDSSPVTEADKASDAYITARLKTLTPGITIISEEGEEHADVSDGRPFWTVDPLDGTKGFISKTARFFVKIALIENFRPILGIIYEPATRVMYWSQRGGDSFRESGTGAVSLLKTSSAPPQGELRTIFNQLHHNPAAFREARDRLAACGIAAQDHETARGSCSTAFHMAVATGEADIYIDCGQNESLRDGNGFSWDYAPDWLILKNAGGGIIEIESGREPIFDKPAQRMNAMIGLGDRKLGKRVFPEYKRDCI